ncbi:MAG TPA: hypothetical protein VGB16_02650, partial [candidate division Zixibacteria bacterium]
TGNLVGYSDCKTSRIETTTDSTPPNQECIEYQYDGDSLLLLKHINTGFNCCPDTIIAGINIKDSLITIQESQSLENGGCKCLCLFDLNFEIRNLEPGEYTIKVISPYIHPDEEQLEFSTTLSSSPSSGRYCVERNHYPWGNTEENPDWINKLIATFASEPVGNPPQSIWQYEYKGQRVYYIPPQCCDQFSTLYNAAGSVICAPDGGYTGEGDGRCTDFFKERKNEKLIWQDSRTN